MPSVHLVQQDIVWEDPSANFARVRSMLDQATIGPGDLVVLPEMFDTGFSLRTERTADVDERSARFLKETAIERTCCVIGGRTVLPEGEEKARNIYSAFGPGGEELGSYAKIHPFTFGREPERLRGGDAVSVFGWGEGAVSVCPAVCYDLRFPELFREGLRLGAEMFVLGANWPSARQHHWRALAIARAIENQAVVVAVNRTGDDPHLSYVGGSIVVSAQGDVLGELGDEEAVLSVEIDAGAIRSWREVFPAWRDGRLPPFDGEG